MIRIENAQEAFNTMVRHLVKQGRKSANEKGCLYRGPDGLKCAFGCLIPDDHYFPSMERLTISALVDDKLVTFDELHTQRMCQRAQSAHDIWNVSRGDFAAYIVSELKIIAIAYGLIFPCDIVPAAAQQT